MNEVSLTDQLTARLHPSIVSAHPNPANKSTPIYKHCLPNHLKRQREDQLTIAALHSTTHAGQLASRHPLAVSMIALQALSTKVPTMQRWIQKSPVALQSYFHVAVVDALLFAREGDWRVVLVVHEHFHVALVPSEGRIPIGPKHGY